MKLTEEFKKQVDEAADREEEALNMEDLDEVAGGFDVSGSFEGPPNCKKCGATLRAPKFRMHPALCDNCFKNIIFQPKRPQ